MPRARRSDLVEGLTVRSRLYNISWEVRPEAHSCARVRYTHTHARTLCPQRGRALSASRRRGEEKWEARI